MKRWALLLLLMVVFGSSTTLASDIRILNLGGLSWLIDDDANSLLNPANAAFLDKRYVSLYLVSDSERYPSGESTDYSTTVVEFVVPTGSILGITNTLGGLFNSEALTEHLKSGTTSYQYSSEMKEFYLQDSLRLTDDLAVGASVAYTFSPMSGHYTFPNGYKIKYQDDGSYKVVEWATAYRPVDGSSIELKLLSGSQNSDVTRLINNNHDNDYQGRIYDYNWTMLTGKVSYTILEHLNLAAKFESRNWKKIDNGQADNGRRQNVMLGASLQASNQLALFAGTDWRQSESAQANSTLTTVLRGGAEYQLTNSVALRGGFSHSQSDQNFSATTVSIGTGINILKGQLELCIDNYTESTKTQSETMSIGFTSLF